MATAILPELSGFSRPRWRDDVPALWRDNTTIQLGDDVIVTRVSRAHLEWMSSLNGLHTTEQVESGLLLPVGESRRLLRAMLAAAALDDAARIPDAIRWAAQEDRDATARRFGAVLRSTRNLEDAYASMAARDAARIIVVGAGVVAEQVIHALDGAGLRRVATGASFAILADGKHPDVPTHFDHDLQDLPHLHIGVLGERAIVGPLVVPGRTSCLRCAHLHKRDADPSWPLLAVQWTHALSSLACPPVDSLLVRIAASYAALLVREWTDDPQDPGLWGNRALEVRLPDCRAAWLARPAHPLCGCLW